MTNEQAYVMDSYKSICLRYDGGLGRRNVGGGGRGGDGLEDLGLGANDKAVGGHQATLRVEQSTAMGASVLELRTTVLVLGSLSDLTIDGLRHAECRRDQRGDNDQGLKKQRRSKDGDILRAGAGTKRNTITFIFILCAE